MRFDGWEYTKSDGFYYGGLEFSLSRIGGTRETLGLGMVAHGLADIFVIVGLKYNLP